jgi:hypothetical protein
MRTCFAALVTPERRRGTRRTPRLHRVRAAYRPCRPHAQRLGRPRPPREIRYAAAACARRLRRPAKARASTACERNARAALRTPTANRRPRAKNGDVSGCDQYAGGETHDTGSSDATMMFLGPSSCRSSAYRASSASAPSRPSHLRTSSMSSETARSTRACVSAISLRRVCPNAFSTQQLAALGPTMLQRRRSMSEPAPQMTERFRPRNLSRWSMSLTQTNHHCLPNHRSLPNGMHMHQVASSCLGEEVGMGAEAS